MTTLTVTLPFSPYRIQVALGRRTYTVNLSPNSPDMRGGYFGCSPRFRAILVSRAKQEMRDTAYALTKDALSRSVPKEPKLLDLYCGAGGAAMGYHRAGFEVVGVDIKPQPHYPFEFHQADAMTYPLDGFDAIHASPPCQHATKAAQQWRKAGREYPNLIPATRVRLSAVGKPYVIENVRGAVLVNPIMLNGAMFGLRVKRDRFFECSFPMPFLLLPSQTSPTRMGRPFDARRFGTFWPVGHFSGVPEARKAMECEWMNQAELAQAIPPAYMEFIGGHLMQEVLGRRDALMASGPTGAGKMAPLGIRLSCTITCRTKARKDRDGALAGLKAAWDGIAQALGVDDSLFEFGDVMFEKGEPEQTRISAEVKE